MYFVSYCQGNVNGTLDAEGDLENEWYTNIVVPFFSGDISIQTLKEGLLSVYVCSPKEEEGKMLRFLYE